jgi:hypothetical protein
MEKSSVWVLGQQRRRKYWIDQVGRSILEHFISEDIFDDSQGDNACQGAIDACALRHGCEGY